MARITEQPQPQHTVHLDLELAAHAAPTPVQPRARLVRLMEPLALPEYLREYDPLDENGTVSPGQ